MPATLSGTNAKAVLVTGASGGIGRAICVQFGQAGWHVGVHYWRGKPAAEATLTAVDSVGGTGTLYQADIRDADAVLCMVREFCGATSGSPVLICNAGIGERALVLRERDERWLEVIATNLSGTFYCLRAMAPFMIERGGGSILVVGSYAGFHGTAGQAAYAASKAGLLGLTKSAAIEWGPHNIRVNLVLPGWQPTALSEGVMSERNWSDHALGRPPSLAEVAGTIVHLAQLNDLSGQVWNCDSRHC